ncbi:hypothetical protein BU23DRAFT_490949 [Bimuria novae-zelandiae CBS 107.79]|uniref:Uncharacterized protein n=1 Tax=Bimuria novae-zelandiae CBS 107.79 TaxID=1447943 RepID=A0A6A5UJW5_9PLEO|nr:hypothetical protein BU23DRAFT_490949 [Bimuria novae-zelandiae CBS 107.79]
MGRQAYLNKIAFGRSAFEPAQTTTSTSEYVQLTSVQQERAHDHGRRLREAQNDVLASIGVVERRRSPSQSLPGSYEERLRELEEEDTVGHAVAITSTLTENACTWWVGSIRERLLTFRYPVVHSFSSIVSSERHLSGRSLIYSGFLARSLYQLCVQATVYGAHILRPVERLLIHHGSRKSRYFYRRWRAAFHATFRISLELLFYPFSYYSFLQRIGLVPPRPLLPPLGSFLPFSGQSPLLPLSVYYSALASPAEFFKALATSPFVFVCLENFFDRWVYAIITAPMEATIIRPTNPDLVSPEEGKRERDSSILGLRKKPPTFVHNAIARLFGLIGWGNGNSSVYLHSSLVGSHTHGIQNGGSIEVGGSHVRNISRREIPAGSQNVPVSPEPEAPETITVPISSLSEALPSSPPASSPLSPTASEASQNDADPRIRITTRGPLVEMEVRLPPQVLSSHTEIAGSGPPTPIQHNMVSAVPMRTSGVLPYHRVSQLSLEPSSMIGSICRAQITRLVSLPLKLVALRLVASHHLAGRAEHAGSRSVYNAFALPTDLRWKSVGVFVSRLALCSMLELALDLGLWVYEYWAVSWLGTRAFDWGAL